MIFGENSLEVTYYSSLEYINSFFYYLWSKINSGTLIFEIAVIAGIGLLVPLLQKWVKNQVSIYMRLQRRMPSWSKRILSFALAFSGPVIAFAFFSCAMSINANFTQNLELYQLCLKLTLIWTVWIFVKDQSLAFTERFACKYLLRTSE